MGERRAEHRARQADEPAQRHAGRDAADAGLDGEVGQRAEHQPDGQPDAERGKHRRAVDEQQHDKHGQQRAAEGRISRCATPRTSPRFQASSGPNGTTTSSGTISGPKVRLKNGAPTEILSPVSASTNSG